MRLSFHGAAREVTGSCMLLESGSTKLLIDCGMFQGERMCGRKNFDEFGFDPATITAVVVTHPHLDHVGRLPRLVQLGFTGPIYFTEPAAALTRIVLEDAAHVMTDNAERCGDETLYTAEDLARVFEQSKPINYHNAFMVGDLSLMFHDAGHVLGSAYVSIEVEGKRLVFSGDIGNDNVPIMSETEPISHADVVICESTYGARIHEPTSERESKLKVVIKQSIEAGGVLLIPAFSIERTQELLYALNNLLPTLPESQRVPIYLDSPLAIRATELYRHFKNYLHFDTPILAEADRDFFSFPNLRETLNAEESKAIARAKKPKVIIAGSGMMTGGRILHHLIQYLPDPNTTLLIIGYLAHGTLGRTLYEGAKEVTIFGRRIEVNAKMVGIGAFSAHGDQNKLTRWLKPTDGKDPQKVFLVHGDQEDKQIFAEHLKKQITSEIIIPEYHQAFDL
ncbi:MAG: MBL fold metallo-hydrolase [Patescibacteria group bacterium]